MTISDPHSTRINTVTTMAPLAKDDPRMIAWERYTADAEHENTKRWAVHPEHVEGSLWAAFIAGWEAAAAGPSAHCHCGHEHPTVVQDGMVSVFHRCRAKGCECREFRGRV